jgi:hypothetical protein
LSLDNVFTVAGIAIEAAIIGLLIHRKIWRKLPIFSVYCVWALLSDGGTAAIRLFHPGWYNIKFFAGETVIDFALQLCVLVELAWSVLHPLHNRLSRKALPVLAAAIVLLGVGIWPFAGISIALPSQEWRFVFQLQQTASILRVVFFLLLAGFSQLLCLGWRDRELQVATGFGFYSIVSLAVAALSAHQSTVVQIRNLYLLVALSFVCSLTYWVASFAQKEAERREFTPQMQAKLITLAEAVHLTCAALADGGNPQVPGGC